ncbi:putative cytosolic iron-sulfur protein assembly protein 1 [Golovinomyces cichoracearum]|uniref:Probable cytosolic iron-sulfur protein assembly protein 1 n=1 Tax=Golovinomyces cichoracearum TaxID=62708 RepID=A0A420HDW9_9PEZI|nr:putative cytosolic iron-sulfur protein assembly protein 1 [Golovinomyces cichoracearum]
MSVVYLCQLSLLAEFKNSSSTRSWVSVPNPNSYPLIATATADKTARVYSLKDFTLHSVLEGGHSRSVRSIAWKPAKNKSDPITLVTGSFDATMGIWRYKNSEEDKSLEKQSSELENENCNGFEIEITHKGKDAVASKSIEKETIKDGEDWDFAIVLEGHDAEIKHVAYSPSGQFLASCSRDKSIWIWEEIGEEGDDEFETVAVLQDHTADVKCISWRRDDGMGELLASAGYDDSIRFWRDSDGEGEWECVAILEAHTGTVWALEWEPDISISKFQSELLGQEEKGVPRLMSASADLTIRLWSKVSAPPPSNRPSYYDSFIPSTMRPGPVMETWEVSASLPQVHKLPIYSISWSEKSGRVLSAGSDGKIVLYEECLIGRQAVGGNIEREWTVIGIFGSSHGPYEVNHITWCGRWDDGRQGEEEIAITTGDDGLVKAWSVIELTSPAKESGG